MSDKSITKKPDSTNLEEWVSYELDFWRCFLIDVRTFFGQNPDSNYWFCFAVSASEKSTISLSLLIALFSALTATEAPVFAFGGNSKRWIVRGHKQNLYVLATPAQCAHKAHPLTRTAPLIPS